jgi:hypothetical protein
MDLERERFMVDLVAAKDAKGEPEFTLARLGAGLVALKRRSHFRLKNTRARSRGKGRPGFDRNFFALLHSEEGGLN